MPRLTNSSCSDYSFISSLDALSISSSARPSSAPPDSRASITTSKSSRRAGKRKQIVIDTNRELLMPTSGSSALAAGPSADTQSGVAALTKASLSTLTDIRQKPNAAKTKMGKPTTRSQSRAGSEVPTASSTSRIVHIKPANKGKGKKIKRETSPSLLHPVSKQEPISPATSTLLTPSEDGINHLSELMVKVELVDSDEEAEMRDEVPELSDFGALRLSEIPRIKTPGPGSVMSTEDAQSTIDSFLYLRASFVSDKANKLKLWQSICIELGLVAIKEEDDLTPVLPATQNRWTQGPRPAVPTTLTAANALLKQRAHVNINQYLEARKKPVGAGQRRDLSSLLHGNIDALVKYTKRSQNYTPRAFAKDEWLQPLMRPINTAGRGRN